TFTFTFLQSTCHSFSSPLPSVLPTLSNPQFIINMHSATILSVFIGAFGFVATASAARTQKLTTDDCCYLDIKARTSQDRWEGLPGFSDILFAMRDLCSGAVKATCSANCCSPTTGGRIGCPKSIASSTIDSIVVALFLATGAVLGTI
ncbi:hypothetical protein DL98DRAFT_623671, partial [Cadophora sp. DSE1049]